MDESLASGPALSWYSGVKGINALLAVVSTPAPVIAATRLRKGSTNSARGAARLVADALVTASRAGVGAAGPRQPTKIHTHTENDHNHLRGGSRLRHAPASYACRVSVSVGNSATLSSWGAKQKPGR